jgi:hypothetical protein
MKKFTVEIIETLTRSVHVTVKAPNEESARDLAEGGDYEDEQIDPLSEEIIDRTIWEISAD